MEFHDNEKHNRFCKVRVSEMMCHAQAGIWILEIVFLLSKLLAISYDIGHIGSIYHMPHMKCGISYSDE